MEVRLVFFWEKMMSQDIDLAIVGVSNLIGETLLEIFEQRAFAVNNLFLVDQEDEVGRQLQFNDQSHKIEALDSFDFSQVQIAVFAADENLVLEYAQMAADQGAIVIDALGVMSDEFDIPLVVPEEASVTVNVLASATLVIV